jgi:hypothetical protein
MTEIPDTAPEIAWPVDGSPVTGPDGRRWQLITHSSWCGKSGWNGKADWHLHEVDANGAEIDDGRYLGETDGGRWPKHALRRAERVAAWIVTHEREADRMVLRHIRAAALGEDNQ